MPPWVDGNLVLTRMVIGAPQHPRALYCAGARLGYGDACEIPEQGYFNSCLVHFGNIADRTGNRGLEFDGASRPFRGVEDANRLLKPSYRNRYQIPEAV